MDVFVNKSSRRLYVSSSVQCSVFRIMELNFTAEDESLGLHGFEGTGLELIEYSLDARKRILLTKLGLVLGFGIMVLSWVFLVSLVFLLVAIVLTCLLFI